MIVVSDTSVVTALIQIGRIDPLSEIFGGIVIPESVSEELAVCHIGLPAWIRTVGVRNKHLVGEFSAELDAGESEAIALALELNADFLPMDERLGRAAAQCAGLNVVGILGVAVAGKRKGLIEKVAPFIRDLREIASFRISAELEARVLRDVGET